MAACWLATPAFAQLELGAKVTAPHWSTWLRGDPIDVLKTPAPDSASACTVWAFCSRSPHRLSADGAYLSDIQARYADRGVQVIAVVKGEDVDGLDRWAGSGVVLDDDGRTEDAWLGDADPGRGNTLVLSPTGTVSFLGLPGAGLVDAIDHLLDGSEDEAQRARAHDARQMLPAGFDDAVAASTVTRLRPLVHYAPRDGLLQGLLYLTLATKANDAVAAAKQLQDAVQRLQGEWRPLAVFADLVLRGDARSTDVVAKLRPTLQKAASVAKHDPLVQLAYLRVLVMAGDGREVGRQAMRIRKRVTQTAAGCLDYATLLALDETPQIHADLATLTLNRAAKLGADARLLAAARYTVALRCSGDEKAADEIISDYLKEQEMRVGLNNDSWYFMTQLPTMGRYDWFAVGMVERMLEQRGSMDYFEFDTAALAMFLVGKVADAVSLQEEAIKKGGKWASPEYHERLSRYKAHLSAAPR